MTIKTSANGVQLIKSFEGCILRAYKDAVGIWTIGYGHTGDVLPGMEITIIQAEEYLKSDLFKFEKSVSAYVTIPLTQDMFDALVSFTYNVGIGAFKSSTLLKKVNRGDIEGAAGEFNKWIYAGKKILPGLVKRREAEKNLFLKGYGSENANVDPSPDTCCDNIIQSFQSWLNCNYNSNIKEDGYWGKLTWLAALKAYQTTLRCPADGNFSPDLIDAIITLKIGSAGNAVHIVQGVLYCRSYPPGKIDGLYGTLTASAIKAFQKDNQLTSDGLAGKKTIYALLHKI